MLADPQFTNTHELPMGLQPVPSSPAYRAGVNEGLPPFDILMRARAASDGPPDLGPFFIGNVRHDKADLSRWHE